MDHNDYLQVHRCNRRLCTKLGLANELHSHPYSYPKERKVLSMSETQEMPATEAESKPERKKIEEPQNFKLALIGPDPARKAVRNAGRKPAERSKTQKAFDSLVKQAYDKWVKAGKPDKFESRPLGMIIVPPVYEEGARKAVRSAGSLHGYSIRFGDSKLDSESGNLEVVFSAVDQKVKPEAATEVPAKKM